MFFEILGGSYLGLKKKKNQVKFQRKERQIDIFFGKIKFCLVIKGSIGEMELCFWLLSLEYLELFFIMYEFYVY